MSNPNFILIDGSYFIFFRYYAILNWCKMAKKDINPSIENKDFVDKFKTTFISKIKEIPKKLKIDKTGGDDTGPIEESDGFVISDRNELMKKLLKKD